MVHPIVGRGWDDAAYFDKFAVGAQEARESSCRTGQDRRRARIERGDVAPGQMGHDHGSALASRRAPLFSGCEVIKPYSAMVTPGIGAHCRSILSPCTGPVVVEEEAVACLRAEDFPA